MRSKRKKPPKSPPAPRPEIEGVTPRRDPEASGVTLIDHSSQARIIGIFGKRGSGKSTLAFKLIRGMPRLIIFDPLKQFKGGQEFDRVIDLIRYCREGRFREERKKPLLVIYRPRVARAEFPYVAKLAFEIGSVCLLAEEISWAISPSKMPEEIEEIIRYGRHQNVELIGISRRPPEVNRDLTANANELYIFRTQEPRDLKYFREFLGDDAANQLQHLPAHTPFVWRDTDQEKRQIPPGKVE